MKAFAIREDGRDKDLAYLIYYEDSKRFFAELPDDADFWETPLLFSSLLKKGQKTIGPYWSKLWVQQRIVPPDRQNIGQILKENQLTEYDEFTLLVLADGRCAQDDYYLSPVSAEFLREKFPDRYQRKVENVAALNNWRLLVSFRDGTVRKCDIASLKGEDRRFAPILREPELFARVSILPGGYGAVWGNDLIVDDLTLYTTGETIPLRMEDLVLFVSNCVINSAEAAALLECSRQNIDDLVRRDKLHPIKSSPKNKLFMKSEVLQRNWT